MNLDRRNDALTLSIHFADLSHQVHTVKLLLFFRAEFNVSCTPGVSQCLVPRAAFLPNKLTSLLAKISNYSEVVSMIGLGFNYPLHIDPRC